MLWLRHESHEVAMTSLVVAVAVYYLPTNW